MFCVAAANVECNPLRAQMVVDPADYRWSSYRAHALGIPDQLVSVQERYERLGRTAEGRQRAYRELSSAIFKANSSYRRGRTLDGVKIKTGAGRAIDEERATSDHRWRGTLVTCDLRVLIAAPAQAGVTAG